MTFEWLFHTLEIGNPDVEVLIYNLSKQEAQSSLTLLVLGGHTTNDAQEACMWYVRFMIDVLFKFVMASRSAWPFTERQTNKSGSHLYISGRIQKRTFCLAAKATCSTGWVDTALQLEAPTWHKLTSARSLDNCRMCSMCALEKHSRASAVLTSRMMAWPSAMTVALRTGALLRWISSGGNSRRLSPSNAPSLRCPTTLHWRAAFSLQCYTACMTGNTSHKYIGKHTVSVQVSPEPLEHQSPSIGLAHWPRSLSRSLIHKSSKAALKHSRDAEMVGPSHSIFLKCLPQSQSVQFSSRDNNRAASVQAAFKLRLKRPFASV